MKIKNKFPELIAEVANSHGGDEKYLTKLTKELCRSGCDAIKYQLILPDEFISCRHSMYSLFKGLQFRLPVWQKISRLVKRSGKMLAFDVYGPSSVSLAKKLKAGLLKIHAMDTDNIDLIKRTVGTGLPVIISTGGATLAEIDNVIRNTKSKKVCLMVGFQSFPTPAEESNLNRIRFLKKKYGCQVGYMDHVSGADRFAYVLPCLAKISGADVIEKHAYLPGLRTKYDWQSAMSPVQITELKSLLETASRSLGKQVYELSRLEAGYRIKYRRCAVAKHDLSAGKNVEAEDIDLLRAEFRPGSRPYYREDVKKILGKRLKRKVKKGDILLSGDLK